MKTSKLTTSLFVLLLLPLIAVAQTPKPELNDQLFEAVRKGDAAAVTELLDKGAEVNAKFRYGMTALFKAAERGHTEVVKVLLARGADVNVKDTFYGATAMTWALENDHFDVVRALLEKSPESAEEVLLNGARGKQIELVRMALERGGAKPATLTVALEAASNGDSKNDEIAEALRKAGAVPPPAIDPATLQSYAGRYKGDPGPEITITLTDGRLFAVRTGQPPLALMAIDQLTFKPIAFDGFTAAFKVENGKATGLELKQGTTTTLLKRIE
jgi:ankyrin repeat protein